MTAPRKELLDALQALRDSDLDRRESALETVEEIAKGGLAANEVTSIIAAASADLPQARYAFSSYDASLIQSVWAHVLPEHVAALVERVPQLSDPGRAAALAALACIGTEESVQAYVRVLRDFGWPQDAYPAMTQPLEHEPAFESVLLPAFVDGSISGLPDEVAWMLLLAYGEANRLPLAVAGAARVDGVPKAQVLAGLLRDAEGSSGIAWRWDDAYAETRYKAALVFDLLGYLGRTPDAVAVLQAGAQLTDPRPRVFAVTSLLRLGETPSASSIDAIASDPETRNLLYDRLAALGRIDLFPKSELFQPKLAESDMVNWLIFPTELGRAPDHIEFMGTVERDLGRANGVFVYFVFRFRTDPPHWSAEDGWMAGISGPFRSRDFPTTVSYGDTFSTFAKWEEFSVDEHVSSVEELMERWRAHHAER